MTLFIHIGTQKTGSTSLQRVCHENREELLIQGLCYPEVEVHDFNKVSHYNSVRGLFSEADADHSKLFFDRVNKISADKILISAENLSNWPNNPNISSKESYFDSKRESLKRLKSLLGDNKVVVIIYTRQVEIYLKSLFKQHLKVNTDMSRSIDHSLDMFLDRELIRSWFFQEAALWDEFFDEVIVKNYEEMRDVGLIKSFLDILGVQLSLPSEVADNVSPDWYDLECTRASRSLGLSFTPRPSETRRLPINKSYDEYVSRVIHRRCKNVGLI